MMNTSNSSSENWIVTSRVAFALFHPELYEKSNKKKKSDTHHNLETKQISNSCLYIKQSRLCLQTTSDFHLLSHINTLLQH